MNKTKKLIAAIYPKTPTDDPSATMGNISKLLYQFQTSPQKLPKAAKDLEKRALECVKVQNMAYVRITVTVFVELIKGTREHLALFEDVLANVITAYCGNPSPEVRCSGIAIFNAYVDVLDSTSAPASRLDFFAYVSRFIEFARSSAVHKLKVAAFQGLAACVRAFELRNAMESFIGKLGKDVVAVILENIHTFGGSSLTTTTTTSSSNVPPTLSSSSSPSTATATATTAEGKPNNNNNNDKSDDKGSAEDANTREVSVVATQCLKDLVERLESMAIASLVDNVLQYFDSKSIWLNSYEFAVKCLQTILRSIKSVNRYLMVVGIVQRIEKLASTTTTTTTSSTSSTTAAITEVSPAVRGRMFSCLASVYTEATGLFSSVLSAAMKHLAASITISVSNKEKEKKEEEEEEENFQAELMRSVCAIAEKVSASATKVEGIELVVTQAAERITFPSSSSSSDKPSTTDIIVAEAFLRMAQELTRTVRRPFSRRPNDSMVAALLTLSEAAAAPEARLLALQLLQAFLSGGEDTSILERIASSNDEWITTTNNNNNNSNSKSVCCTGLLINALSLDDPAVTSGVKVRETLLRSLSLDSNKPRHVLEIWRVLVVLLARLGDREVPFAVPFLFEIQRSAQKSKRATSLDRAKMALVAACMIALSRFYGAEELRVQALEFLEGASEVGLASKELGVDPDHGFALAMGHTKWRKPYESEGPMSIGFERAKVVDTLCAVDRLARGYTDLHTLLSAEWKAVAAGSVTIEMRVGTTTTATTTNTSTNSNTNNTTVTNTAVVKGSKKSSSSSSFTKGSKTGDDKGDKEIMDDGDEGSHLVSLTRFASSSVSINSDSIADIPFTDYDDAYNSNTDAVAFVIPKKSDIVTYKNVTDVLSKRKTCADVMKEKRKKRREKEESEEEKEKEKEVVEDSETETILSFEDIAGACAEYEKESVRSFASVCEDIPKTPAECKTDLIGEQKPADPRLFAPKENPDVDMNSFVEARQHFPQTFQVLKE